MLVLMTMMMMMRMWWYSWHLLAMSRETNSKEQQFGITNGCYRMIVWLLNIPCKLEFTRLIVKALPNSTSALQNHNLPASLRFWSDIAYALISVQERTALQGWHAWGWQWWMGICNRPWGPALFSRVSDKPNLHVSTNDATTIPALGLQNGGCNPTDSPSLR